MPKSSHAIKDDNREVKEESIVELSSCHLGVGKSWQFSRQSAAAPENTGHYQPLADCLRFGGRTA